MARYWTKGLIIGNIFVHLQHQTYQFSLEHLFLFFFFSLTYWGYDEPDDWKGDYPDGEDCARMGVKDETSDLNSWFDK